MQIHGVTIDDTYAEAFRMWAARLIVTAIDEHWVRIAAQEATGYGTSVIACDAEAGLEQWLDASQTPDGRPGAALMFFSFKADPVAAAVLKRTGQCLMTCPTTAVYDGLPKVTISEDSSRFGLGNKLRFFGDGFQKSKLIGNRRFWRVPVMDGEFTCEESAGSVKAIGGGNFLICGRDLRRTLDAARRAIDAIAPLPGVITPFPGGVVRSGSKVGSRYKALFASTNDAFCPTVRSQVASALHPQAQCVYEIIINGLSFDLIARAMRTGILAACADGTDSGIVAISAGNYGGRLGKFHFKLHDVLAGAT